MLSKIGQRIETVGQNKIVRKTFQRGLQTIESLSAYAGDKLYYRKWVINEYGKIRKFSQSYSSGYPIKGSKCILNIIV